MATMYKAFEFPGPHKKLEATERKLEEPGPGQVRIKVKACGACHGEIVGFLGMASAYPRIPGHEIAGIVDAVGEGVTRFKPGDRAGVGWFGKQCFECKPCRGGDFILCNKHETIGLQYDGGYAEYATVPQESMAKIPDGMDFKQAGPLMCAGLTVYNSLRHTKAVAGDVVVVQGTGGLGHLGIQFANKMGFHTVAVSRGQEKKEGALKLGAHKYVDVTTEDPVKEIQALGGAKVILSTVTDMAAMSSIVPCLGKNGCLLVLGVGQGKLEVDPMVLISNKATIQGWASGTPSDSEDTMNFAQLAGITSVNEVFPASKALEAYERMMSGRAHFRVVLDWEAEEK
ncbi:alcohol dehydrogenase [Klebsormidium nitens]|uniref:Alcohol dehydrogenase n=1 Tax=Klebsormidium nitens TaxID=105231 RepID=A0A1Y1HXQ7_KLENI|nr:alcohol dehydrogenase [Klebsormidium nitens]|eukprot:GAQ82943.1 alcohol dehydrogenase [Klebsormidium nitens]